MAEPEMMIRPAAPQDAEGMARIDEECFSLPWSFESFHRELTKNRIAVYYVAESGGDVVGYAGLWRVEDEGHITNVAVLPGYRGMSIASELLTALFGKCGGEGIVDYTLEVRKSNAAAICLYEKFGFAGEGIRPRYYQDDNEDALIMWRRGDRPDTI